MTGLFSKSIWWAALALGAGCTNPVMTAPDLQGMAPDSGLTAVQRRWTVIRPPATGEPNLFSIWGESPDHFFAVGGDGAIVRAVPAASGGMDADGLPLLSFVRTQGPAKGDLRGVHGTGASNIFAVGLGGAILHYDGNAWTPETPQMAMAGSPFTTDLFGVFAYKSSAVAVGNGGTWIKRDQTGWGAPPAPLMVESLAAVSGVSPEGNRCLMAGTKCDIYAVGATGFVFHYDETNWQAVSPNGFTTSLAGVFGSAPNNVYAVGLTGAVLRNTGGGFSDYGMTINPTCGTGPLSKAFFRNGVVLSSGAVVLSGWEGAITRIAEAPCGGKPSVPGATDESGVTGQRLEGMWSYSLNQKSVVYIVGAEGVILRGQ